MYKRNGKYYILTDHPASVEYTLQASSPFGSYSYKALVNFIAGPISGGNPHQGGIVNTPEGNWSVPLCSQFEISINTLDSCRYYMAFEDNYPGGRVPVYVIVFLQCTRCSLFYSLAPITWGSDGFPAVTVCLFLYRIPSQSSYVSRPSTTPGA